MYKLQLRWKKWEGSLDNPIKEWYEWEDMEKPALDSFDKAIEEARVVADNPFLSSGVRIVKDGVPIARLYSRYDSEKESFTIYREDL